MEYPTYDAIVIGTGAAGYSAACRIAEERKKTVAIVTENINFGTSRNTGSDKQTYYKLGLGGNLADSVREMALNLFDCGSVDGDTALCEAALSSRCFFNLCELGVPFPVNRYGEYIGYKTDHDPYARATSAGPLTSKFMTEALQNKAEELRIKTFDKYLAVEILKNENGVCGLICLNTTDGNYKIFRCANIVLATGGPAGIYKDSVYPDCHTGSTGLALNAGIPLQNTTEWQYGLASIKPRWNVSGTYMQVIPRFVSIDSNGIEHEFLADYFTDIHTAMSTVFLKGYQWPFDSKKIMTGSSVIDLLVYRESVLKNRKVYLDYTKNPFGLDKISYEKLSEEAYGYLQKADACFGKPIDRLKKMNEPAIDLYMSKGIDIEKEPLEIALCAQHNNGGIAVNMWWQTEVKGLFAAGECAGTHGVTRPGGSALNSGQVGALRAAQYICGTDRSIPQDSEFERTAENEIKKHLNLKKNVLKNKNNADEYIQSAQKQMSECCAAVRNTAKISEYIKSVEELLSGFTTVVGVETEKEIYKVYKLKDILTVQNATLRAVMNYAQTAKSTRGSALYTDCDGVLREGLEEIFRFKEDTGLTNKKIQQIGIVNNHFEIKWREVRPIPESDDFFENIWNGFRKNRNIF